MTARTIRSGQGDPAGDAYLGPHGVVRGRPPARVRAKQQVTLRLDPDIIERFRADGPGWQGRINEALRKVVGRRLTGNPSMYRRCALAINLGADNHHRERHGGQAGHMQSNFPDIPAQEVAKLRNADPAVKRIAAASDKISLSWMREAFKRDNGIKDSLKYGTAVLSDVDQLNQYLYTYGKMIDAQWEHILKNAAVNDGRTRLIDYGCGQGLAGLIMHDKLGEKLGFKVGEIFLIEPSAAALVRAEAVYRNLFPKATITCLNVMSTDLERKHFPNTPATTVHIFSNVLDIPGFDQSHVFNSTLSTGRHVILAVSHNRGFAGGAARVRAIKEEMEKEQYRGWVSVRSSEIEEFTCGVGGKFPAISWTANVDITRG